MDAVRLWCPRACFLAPPAHKDLRQKLLDEFDPLAVISLPAGGFKPYAGVKSGILVFRKPPIQAKQKSTEKVWFFEVRNDGYDPDKITGGGRPETPELNGILELLKLWAEYKDSAFERVPGVETGTVLPAGSSEPRCWWANIETIDGNDYHR